MRFYPLFLGIMLVLLTSARGAGQGESPRGTLLELGPMEVSKVSVFSSDFQAKWKRDLAARADEFSRLPSLVVYQQLFQQHVAETVTSRKVRYASVDAHGDPRSYSGRVYLPSRDPGTPPTLLPLVVYQHATETRRAFTTYFGKGDEAMLGALAAEGCGFAVAMPDGDGMGADASPEMHAYCHGPTTAICLIDMIRAALGEVNGDSVFDDDNYEWDGRIFIVGYSEGGYIAMAAVKELSTNPDYQDLSLTGAACMAGPFNFSGSTRKLLDDGKTPYSRPYIPAYFLDAWADIYPKDMVFADAINPRLLETAARVPGLDVGNIKTWLDGKMGGDEITARMQARLTGDKGKAVPVRAVLNETWYKANIENRASPLSKLLDQNDLVGSWRPAMPVLLVHSPEDETADFANTLSMFESWKANGASPRAIVELVAGGTGPGHVLGAVVAIPTAFVWINAGMPTSLMDKTTQDLKEYILDNTPDSILEAAEVLQSLGQSREDDALLPLSKIDCAPRKDGSPYKVSINDKLFTLGKVKLYTRSLGSAYPGQNVNRAVHGYTRLLKVLRNSGDSCLLPTLEPVYMAVYPTKGAVALTLKFEGGPQGQTASYTLNIKGVKNKLIARRLPPLFTLSDNFKPAVHQANFEHAKHDEPFIHLP